MSEQIAGPLERADAVLDKVARLLVAVAQVHSSTRHVNGPLPPRPPQLAILSLSGVPR